VGDGSTASLVLMTRLFVVQRERFALMKSKLVFAILTALVALIAVAGTAKAASCPSTGAKKAFSQWGDQRSYVLAPDGGFEAGALGWDLDGAARAVAGNESYYLNNAVDRASLSLPAGSSAGSPPVCMDIGTPSFRMMARNTGDPRSQLRVTASYKLLGLLRTQTLATVTAGSAWAPTASQSTVLTLSTIVGTLIPSGIEVRVTPLDSKGNWQVDDLYIDPFARR
jgi:hypothetical protein